jgi:hypothetical protein
MTLRVYRSTNDQGNQNLKVDIITAFLEALEAVKFSWIDNIEFIAIFALLDHPITLAWILNQIGT